MLVEAILAVCLQHFQGSRQSVKWHIMRDYSYINKLLFKFVLPNLVQHTQNPVLFIHFSLSLHQAVTLGYCPFPSSLSPTELYCDLTIVID